MLKKTKYKQKILINNIVLVMIHKVKSSSYELPIFQT